jgi:hypothetical protein
VNNNSNLLEDALQKFYVKNMQKNYQHTETNPVQINRAYANDFLERGKNSEEKTAIGAEQPINRGKTFC